MGYQSIHSGAETDKAISAVQAVGYDVAGGGFGYAEPVKHLSSEDGIISELLDEVLASMNTKESKQISMYDSALFSSDVMGTLYKHSDTDAFFDLSTAYCGGCRVMRVKLDGAWSQYIFETPNLSVDVEYRVAERYSGGDVYTKVVSFGLLPSNSASSLEHGAEATKIIRCAGMLSDGRTMPFNDGSNKCDVYADASKVYIVTNTDFSDITATVQIWYTKNN